MAGNHIYIGKMLESTVQSVNALVVQMQDVVNNTKYIKNLYDSNGMRETLTYSAVNNSLLPQQYTAAFGFIKTNGNTISFGPGAATRGVSVGSTGNTGDLLGYGEKDVDLTGVSKIIYKYKAVNRVSMRFNNTNIPLVGDGLEHTGEYIVPAGTGIVKIQLYATSYSYNDIATIHLYDALMLDAQGNTVGYVAHGSDYNNVSNQVAVPKGQTVGYYLLKPPTATTPVSKWDLLNIMALDNSKITIRIINIYGRIIATLKPGDYMDFGLTDFLTLIEIQGADNVMSGVAYRYIK